MDRSSSIATLLGIVAALSLWFAMLSQTPFPSGEFGIYLTSENLKVVSDQDIQYYNASSHEFTLTSECAERLKPMGWRLFGNFTIVVNGKVELSGLFVPPVVSRSYSGSQVVMLYPTYDLSSMNYRVMKIQMGYPWDQSSLLDFANPLDNPTIAAYFERSGRLIR